VFPEVVNTSGCLATLTDNYNNQTSSSMMLYTGGKGVAGRQNLFAINVSATAYANPVLTGEILIPAFYTTLPVPNGAIKVLGKSPGNDNILWTVLPSGATVDITPQAPMPCYTHTVVPTQIPVTLTANGNDLSQTNPTFCVGQQIIFALNISATYMSGLFQWTFPDKYVNAVSPPNSARCIICTDNSSLLVSTNNSCTNWYVNGTGGTVNVGASLIMPNGQSVALAALGQFTIYRPTNSDFTPILNNLTWSFPNLQAAMSWNETLDSEYDGQFGITQLLLGTGIYYGTGGQYVLDGNTAIYGETGTNGPSPYSTNDPSQQTLHFLDTPNAPTLSMNLTFQDYLVFQPAGNNSIFVTIATNGWFANASVSLSGVITPASLQPASDPVDSDVFPTWTENRPE
jgi:hypothetical protein